MIISGLFKKAVHPFFHFHSLINDPLHQLGYGRNIVDAADNLSTRIHPLIECPILPSSGRCSSADIWSEFLQ